MEEILTRLEKFYDEEVSHYLSVIRLEGNEENALKCVSQALLWSSSIMEFHEKNTANYSTWKKTDPAYGVVNGIRYARHRVMHQFLQLLHITDGAELPVPLPFPFFEIRWVGLENLPPPDKGHEHRSKARDYKDYLENVPVRSTFDVLSGFFERAHNA